MDVGVDLVEWYLRLNGYLTLGEFTVVGETERGYRAITDVDVVGLRVPGAIYAGLDPHDVGEAELLLIEDPELHLEEDVCDVIVGEVKESEAVFNPGLKDHRVLHAVLRRLEWLYGEPLTDVVDRLQREGTTYSPGPKGHRIRTRMVAFGRSVTTDLNTVALSHVVETMVSFFERFDEVISPIQYKDPAPALLRLLVKVGFTVRASGPTGEPGSG